MFAYCQEKNTQIFKRKKPVNPKNTPENHKNTPENLKNTSENLKYQNRPKTHDTLVTIMATYTQADLDAVRAAKLSYVTGGRVKRVTVGGKTIEYSDDTGVYDQLSALENEILSALGSVYPRAYGRHVRRR